MHILKLPKGVVHNVNVIILGLLWAGTQLDRIFYISSLEILNVPIKHSSWGLKDTTFFKFSLLLKNIWREVCSHGLWNQIIKEKHRQNIELIGLLPIRALYLPISRYHDVVSFSPRIGFLGMSNGILVQDLLKSLAWTPSQA